MDQVGAVGVLRIKAVSQDMLMGQKWGVREREEPSMTTSAA